MEEDCVSALYASLGLSAGAELSSDDVSLLFSKVFHVSSDSDEAHEAMKKIARGDNSWSCSGQNVLDVLFKIKMEREKKEMSYWDFQLLNSGNLYITDHQSKDAGTFSSLTRGLVGRKERCNRVMNGKRLKKAAGQSWARLASEGVKSILPFPWQGQRLGPRSQAWGSISLSDVLLLVEVKYEAVMLLLYREMLQKHHTEGVWEMLHPWQRHQEVEVLGDLVQDALESADTSGLALLPGALRIYKTCSRSHLSIDPESVEQSWSAVTFLNELNTFRQQEQKTLTALGQRLCGESLRLLCLYISLATHRAQREKTSQGALLAARQSWDAWPQVASPCRAEQVSLWLHDRGEEEEEKEDFKILQQTELQLLVLTQEKERRHLIMLLHQISVENLQESDTKQASLKAGCIRRLRQIHHQLQTQSGAQTPSKKTTFQNKTQEKSSQILEDCAMLLVTYLIELQEVQAFNLLQALQGQNAWDVQALRDKYEAETETQQFTNLLHLLMSDDPLTSGSKLTENTSTDQTGPASSHNEETAGESVAAPVRSEPKEVHSANVSAKQEVCAGCGVVMEDLPYLEISCAPEAQGDAPEGLSAADEEEQNGATNGHENYEKQRSLITFAWSKPTEEDAGYEEKAADEETKPSQDGQSSGKTQLLSTQCEKIVLERNEEEQNQKKEADQPEGGDVGSDPETEKLQVFSPHISGNSSESTGGFCSETSDCRTSTTREVSEVEACPSESKPWDLRGLQHSDHEDLTSSQESTKEGSVLERNTRESTLMERGQATHPVSAVERERTMRNLVDMQRRFEEKHQRDKERQFLRVKERLAIIQNRKAEEDLLGLKNADRLIHLTQDLPMEDKNQQKTVVKERLEQLRRERSYIMQSKRDRNTMGFKELLAPVHLHSSETEDGTN